MTVLENVMSGLAEQKELLDKFEEVSNKLGEVTDPERCKTSSTTSRIAGKDRCRRSLGSSAARLRLPSMRCAARLPRSEVTNLSGGENAAWRLPPVVTETRSAAARRTDQPFGR